MLLRFRPVCMELSKTIILLRELLELLQMQFTHLLFRNLGSVQHRVIASSWIEFIELVICGRCVQSFWWISIKFQTSYLKVYATVIENRFWLGAMVELSCQANSDLLLNFLYWEIFYFLKWHGNLFLKLGFEPLFFFRWISCFATLNCLFWIQRFCHLHVVVISNSVDLWTIIINNIINFLRHVIVSTVFSLLLCFQQLRDETFILSAFISWLCSKALASASSFLLKFKIEILTVLVQVLGVVCALQMW